MQAAKGAGKVTDCFELATYVTLEFSQQLRDHQPHFMDEKTKVGGEGH